MHLHTCLAATLLCPCRTVQLRWAASLGPNCDMNRTHLHISPYRKNKQHATSRMVGQAHFTLESKRHNEQDMIISCIGDNRDTCIMSDCNAGMLIVSSATPGAVCETQFFVSAKTQMMSRPLPILVQSIQTQVPVTLSITHPQALL